MHRRFILLSLIFLFSFPPLSVAEEEAEKIFMQGLRKYVVEDHKGAITDFEKVLQIKPDHNRAKTFLLRLLPLIGSRCYEEGKYEEALFYFEKLYLLAPYDTEVRRRMYEIAQVSLEAAKKIEESKKEKVTVLPKEREPILEEEILRKQQEIFREEGKKLVSTYSKREDLLNEALGDLVTKIDRSDTERKQLLLEMEKGRTVTKNLVWRAMRLTTIAAGLIATLTFFLIYYFSRKAAIRRQIVIAQYQQNILSLVTEGPQKERVVLPSGEIVTDFDPKSRQRAKYLEVMAKELEKEKDKEVVLNLFRPFLFDKDNRVRANAALALYSHHPEMSLQTFKKMSQDENEWMRGSAAWALGEIPCPEAVEILFNLLNDQRDKVKLRTAESLTKIKEKEEIPQGIKERIDQQLKSHAERSGLHNSTLDK